MKLKLRENADINVVTGISDIIIDSINKKWDNIRDLNSIIVNLNEEGYEDLVPVIESILEDENKNVGKLQQLIELISPTASSIDDGRQEAIDELDNIEEIKVEEEMKLSENFSNVPEKTTTVVDPVFGKAIEDKEEDEKVIEDALKENEKLAKETIPKEGETGKKVTSKALKAMHLSESLFDEDLDEDKADDFKSKVYNALSDIMYDYQWDDVSREDMEKALEWFDIHFWGSDDDVTENFSEGEEVTLTEDADSPQNKKEAFKKKLENFVKNKEKEFKVKISDEDQVKFVMFALGMVQKYGKEHKDVSGSDIAELVNGLFRNSFNFNGEYIRDLEENLLKEKKEPVDNIKLDIAREQLKRFKEGKMPSDWSAEDYIKGLVSRKHLTKEEGDQLLSESFDESQLNDIQDFKSCIKMALTDITRSYRLLSDNAQDSFDLATSLVHDAVYDLTVLLNVMDKFELEDNE